MQHLVGDVHLAEAPLLFDLFNVCLKIQFLPTARVQTLLDFLCPATALTRGQAMPDLLGTLCQFLFSMRLFCYTFHQEKSIKRAMPVVVTSLFWPLYS